MAKELKLYAIRNKSTGKLVNNITYKPKRFWERRADAINALEKANNRNFRWCEELKLELVTFKLVEVTDDE